MDDRLAKAHTGAVHNTPDRPDEAVSKESTAETGPRRADSDAVSIAPLGANY